MPGPTNATPTSESPFERTFVDEEGAIWHVFEQVLAEYDRRRSRSLIFASESVIRRVRHFPENWADLSDDELALLSWKA